MERIVMVVALVVSSLISACCPAGYRRSNEVHGTSTVESPLVIFCDEKGCWWSDTLVTAEGQPFWLAGEWTACKVGFMNSVEPPHSPLLEAEEVATFKLRNGPEVTATRFTWHDEHQIFRPGLLASTTYFINLCREDCRASHQPRIARVKIRVRRSDSPENLDFVGTR